MIVINFYKMIGNVNKILFNKYIYIHNEPHGGNSYFSSVIIFLNISII